VGLTHTRLAKHEESNRTAAYPLAEWAIGAAAACSAFLRGSRGRIPASGQYCGISSQLYTWALGPNYLDTQACNAST
jgi:hypothetical protein